MTSDSRGTPDPELDEISRQIERDRKGKRRRPERRQPPNTRALMDALQVLHGEAPDEKEKQ